MMLPVCLFVFSLQSQVQELNVVAADIGGGKFSYHSGFDSEKITFAKDGKFGRTYWSDTSLHDKRSRGTWRLDGDAVVITYAAGAGTRRLVPIRWDSHLYLIRETELPHFAKWSKEKAAPGSWRRRAGNTYLVKAVPDSPNGLFVPKSHLSYFR